MIFLKFCIIPHYFIHNFENIPSAGLQIIYSPDNKTSRANQNTLKNVSQQI